MSEIRELSDKAEADLKILLSLTEEQRMKIITILAKEGFENIDAAAEKIREEFNLDTKVAQTVSKSYLEISRICSDQDESSKFLEGVKSIGFSSNEVDVVARVIDRLRNEGLISKASEAIKRMELQYFALPHFSGMELNMDYRVFKNNSKMEIIPMVVCEIRLHKSFEGSQGIKQIVFQMAPEDIEYMIRFFEDFKKEGTERTEFIKGRRK